MSYQTFYTLDWKGNTPTLKQVAQVLALTSFRSEKRGPSTIYDTPRRMEATILSWDRQLLSFAAQGLDPINARFRVQRNVQARGHMRRIVRAHKHDCKIMMPVPITKRMRENHGVPRGYTKCTCGGMLVRINRPTK